MARVTCPLGSPATAGVPATVAEMSIRQAASPAARSDGYKTIDAQRRENRVQPTGVRRAS